MAQKIRKTNCRKTEICSENNVFGSNLYTFHEETAIVQGSMTAQRYVDTLQGYLLTRCRGFDAQKAVL
jgi:hypothetical protein